MESEDEQEEEEEEELKSIPKKKFVEEND